MRKLNLNLGLIVVFLILRNIPTFASTFQCERVLSPDLQVNQVKFCNSSYVDKLPSPNKVGKTTFNNELYYNVLNKNNLGGVKVLFPNDQEKIVYRSSYLVGAPLCIQNLSNLGVNTVINLYSGNLGYAPNLYHLEQHIFKENKVTNYTQTQGYMVDALNLTPKELNLKIAAIIKSIATAKGNVLIHCYTGEHDTGVIFGVLNKCYNKQMLKNIRQDTLCHMGETSDYQYKTFQHAMKIIEQFPCELLSK